MFIDEIKINIKSGKGGAGRVSFDRMKGRVGLPDGGNGGDGGDVYLVGVSDLAALYKYRFEKDFSAEDGIGGMKFEKTGRSGEDLFLKVPLGTIAHNLTTKEDVEVVEVGQKIMMAKGGRGGRGNMAFKSSVNRSPKKAEPGKPGEEFDILLELRLIADIGFIGMPNAGKSSMLNELTAAGAKVANYPFTTLEPNLGVIDDIIIADIPGLIEGASAGKGLGIKFLRHIQRTKYLVHFVSAESKSVVRDYRTIRRELTKYDKKLIKKKEYVFLAKYDLASDKEKKEKINKLKKINSKIMAVSIHDWDSIQKIRKLFQKIVKKK